MQPVIGGFAPTIRNRLEAALPKPFHICFHPKPSRVIPHRPGAAVPSAGPPPVGF